MTIPRLRPTGRENGIRRHRVPNGGHPRRPRDRPRSDPERSGRLPRISVLVLVVVGLLLLQACGGTNGSGADGRSASGAAGGSPVTVRNCGEELAFDAPPERVVLLESAPVTILDGLGVLDRVVARAGSFPADYYDADLAARIEAIPALSEDLDASGHLMISQEVVIAQNAQLVLGLPDGITRERLKDAGAQTLVQPQYCAGEAAPADFGTLYAQIRDYGRLFDREDRAEALIAELEDRVSAVAESRPETPRRTAAVLYPSAGGGPLYAYGAGSMAQPQLEAAGLENVFADARERVFEVGTEELVSRDPEVLILLHQGGEAGTAEEIADIPGAESMRAVQNGEMLLQAFNFTEPASPLVVTGLERISERFGVADR